MVAPKAESIFTMRSHRAVGIVLFCPECPPILGTPLRVETGQDYNPPFYPLPDLVTHAGPLGFIARCDDCGFRVEMRGDRLPTVAMMARDARNDTPLPPMVLMCPHCGELCGAGDDGLTPYHSLPTDQECPGSRQNPRNPESDRRLLWSGEPNPHAIS